MHALAGQPGERQRFHPLRVNAGARLVKGAAGQAIQNMNLMFGFDETLGLRQPALTP